MYVRCPIDREYPDNPRVFATGQVVSIDEFNQCAQIRFYDPYGYKQYFLNIPDAVDAVPLKKLMRCRLYKGTKVKYGQQEAQVVEYKTPKDTVSEYYLQLQSTKELVHIDETKILASFFSGGADPQEQLENYEFQNPCWYLGHQVVSATMNVLENSLFGFKELSGCKIYLKAFQLNTIMRCLQGDTCRYMLADEVGLGKTIEACSVVKIFLSNRAKRKVLVAVPQSLVAQWRTEMLFKFGIVEGENRNHNFVRLMAVEDLNATTLDTKWDFVIVDEVHNYLSNDEFYQRLHTLSLRTKNIILLSATPIQQRKNEYLALLRLVLPQKYDAVTLDEFSVFVGKQHQIAKLTHGLLDELDSLKNEILPEVPDGVDPHTDEDVQETLEEIKVDLDRLSAMIGDNALAYMIQAIDTSEDDLGVYAIQVVLAYVCDNYQIERSIIRGRRAVLGVYPQDPEGEFSERKLQEVSYVIDEDHTYYESEAYRLLVKWIVSQQDLFDEEKVLKEIKPLLEAFFSSPWAYMARLKAAAQYDTTIPAEVMKSAQEWLADENRVIDNLADSMDQVDEHPSRLLKLISYIDTELFGQKVVVFTDQSETFCVFYQMLQAAFGDEVTGFAESLDTQENEINIYRFQSDPKCKILICDQTGGEGRNLQIADYAVHVDIPWSIHTIEQRIGRLDRMGRNIEVPVTSVVIHSQNTYEDQLFKLWNEGLKVFDQSLSGLEIIMNDINRKIVSSIRHDFEYGLYRLVPELIKEAHDMRETVQREQIFDTAALRYKPLYLQLKKLLANYQFNENKLFANTMMSWASLAGFGALHHNKERNMVSFAEQSFSVKSAMNSYLLPPNWEQYLAKKQNEIAIRVQRGIAVAKKKHAENIERTIRGTFDRNTAIKNDYVHFFAPGDEIFDCIVDNAMHSYKGMCTAFAAESEIDWQGFVYTYSIEPDERLLLSHGVPLFALGQFRQYISSSLPVVPVPFASYSDVPDSIVIAEHKRICSMGYFHQSNVIDHLGRRGKSQGFLHIPSQLHTSNIEWFKAKYNEELWSQLVSKSRRAASHKAKQIFEREADLRGARDLIDQIMSSRESRARYFGTATGDALENLRRQYELIYKSLEKPIIRLETACFMWLVRQ